jgi:MoaA/NifB/PqqE/SkfB family radical SAM enzyme
MITNLFRKLPAYYLFRKTGWPRMLPMSLTLSVTYRCNSHCKTCNIHNKTAKELSLEEWEKVADTLRGNVFWLTFSGGEPFLRKDLVELVQLFYRYARPSIINIPTNGLLSDVTLQAVKRIAISCEKAQIIVNVSIDDIEEKHDIIRGVQGSYNKAIETFRGLKGLKLPNLTVGIHTVISRYNVSNVPQIYDTIRSLSPDSYVTEIAEEREELCTVGSGITPQPDEYSIAADFLIDAIRKHHLNGVGRVAGAFRIQYYDMVKRLLSEDRQIIPCYAGFASAQIAPDGEVWACCTKAESMGNLRDYDYDFKRAWFSEKAEALRRSIKNGMCYCPLANVSYTNMLFNPSALMRVSLNYLGKSRI